MALQNFCPIPKLEEGISSLRDTLLFTSRDTIVGFLLAKVDGVDRHVLHFTSNGEIEKLSKLPRGLHKAPAHFNKP